MEAATRRWIAGILMILAGGTGTCVFGLATASSVALYNYYGDYPLYLIVIYALLTAGFSYLCFRGIRYANS